MTAIELPEGVEAVAGEQGVTYQTVTADHAGRRHALSVPAGSASEDHVVAADWVGVAARRLRLGEGGEPMDTMDAYLTEGARRNAPAVAHG